MTPEEIQSAIEGMLSVQRQLQDDQLRVLSAVDGLVQVSQDNQQRSIENRDYLDRLADIAIEVRAETAELREQNAQLRRGMDYLLSKDGGEG